MILAAWLTTALAAAPCAAQVPAWRADVDAALQAYGQLDEPAFLAAAERAEAAVACLTDRVTPADAAAWHLLAAVRGWYSHEGPVGPAEPPVLHLRAALLAGLDDAAWPDVLVPGSPLADLLADARLVASDRQPLLSTPAHAWQVDGADAVGDVGLPAIVQLRTHDTLRWTRSFEAPWPALPAPPRSALGIATGVTGGLAAVAWGVAIGTRLADRPQDNTLLLPNHVALPMAGALTAGAVGLGVATLVDHLAARRAP